MSCCGIFCKPQKGSKAESIIRRYSSKPRRISHAQRDGSEKYKKIDMAAYNKYTFNMYGGDIEYVTLVFSNHMMNAALDRFCHDIIPIKVDNRHFQITVPIAISQQFFGWLFSLGNTVKITKPEWVRQKMKDMLEEVKNRKYSDRSKNTYLLHANSVFLLVSSFDLHIIITYLTSQKP